MFGTAKLQWDMLPLSSGLGRWLLVHHVFSYVISCYGNFPSCPVCFCVHEIVLQFYVFFSLFTPHVVAPIFPALFLV
jgi:hypothetical protein